MRVLFAGTPEFAAVVLELLLGSRHQVVGVLSQPSRPRGRGLQVADPPAVGLARRSGLPVLQPTALHQEESLAEIRRLEPEVIVTAAFGRLLRPALLDLPPGGCWNVHASLLPRHRGASPVAASIMAGDPWSGVTLFQMDPGLDTGPILLQEMVPVEPRETTGELTERLARLGGALAVRGLDLAERHQLRRRPQPRWGATYAPIMTKEDGRIPWNRPSDQVDRWVRALNPWPGAFTFAGGKRLTIHRIEPIHRAPVIGADLPDLKEFVAAEEPAPPGSLTHLPEGLGVVCRPGIVRLQEVQQEGKRRQEAEEWFRGSRLKAGARLDRPG